MLKVDGRVLLVDGRIFLAALTLAGCASVPESAPQPAANAAPAPVAIAAPAPVAAAAPAPVAAAAPAPVAAAAPAPVAAAAPAPPHSITKAMPSFKADMAMSVQMAQPIIPTRAFCLKGKSCESGYAAHGYILLTKKATDGATKERYQAICRSYLANLEPENNFSGTPKSQIATTFWFLTSQPQKEDSCEELIEKYDYARATKVLASLKILKIAGPLLVAWENPYADQNEKTQRLLIDMTHFTEPKDVDNAFGIWRDKVSQDKKFWDKRLDVDLVKLELKVFIQKYGESIVKVIKSV